jgi:hypothetical protein
MRLLAGVHSDFPQNFATRYYSDSQHRSQNHAVQSRACPTQRKTQAVKILELLISARGAWVPALALSQVSLQYNARVYSLRRLGISIENRLETGPDGSRHGFFRLRGGMPAPAPQPAQAAPAPADADPAPSLFGDPPLWRYPD